MNCAWQVGEWKYNPSAGELCSAPSCRDVRRLEPKVAQVLEYLLQHSGEVVSREAMMAHVWPGLVVVDESLTRCISLVRNALGDSVPRRYVETLPKRGYRLIAAVAPVQGRPHSLAPCAANPAAGSATAAAAHLPEAAS